VVIRPPTVTSLAPATGMVGQIITVTGTGLTGVSEVQFQGARAEVVTPVSATSLQVTVPAGAVTGRLTIVGPGGQGMSTVAFRVAPKIVDFTPTTGILGTPVTLTGFNLSSGNVSPVVQVGTATAVVSNVSATSVTMTIPPTAATGRLTVKTADGVATTVASLVVIRPPTVTSLAPAT